MNEPKQIRILVTEDSAMNAVLITTLLKKRGYQVELAEDGEQCLEKVRQFAPNLILLDLMLPQIHGMEVLRRLKADSNTSHIGVIICTVRKYKPDMDQAMELGAFDVLFKPFQKEELFGIVERYFSGAPVETPRPPAPAPTEAFIPQIAPSRAQFRLWGTRGSLPVSGQRYARYGGNTSCLEVVCGEDRVIVDAGSGLRDLGYELAQQGPRKHHILIGHTHWDHIQGFPFFVPAYEPGYELVIYGATGFAKDLESVFSGQLDRSYFPVQFQDMQAKIEFRRLEHPPLDIGGIRVWWELSNHPGATLCFKFEAGGKTLGYLTDNEFLYGYLGAPNKINLNSKELIPHRPLVDFLSGIDMLIGEAQYSNDEYASKIGWGHSSISNACILARFARVREWIVTHHDPQHDDKYLEQQLNMIKEILKSLDYHIPVSLAYDEMTGYL